MARFEVDMDMTMVGVSYTETDRQTDRQSSESVFGERQPYQRKMDVGERVSIRRHSRLVLYLGAPPHRNIHTILELEERREKNKTHKTPQS